MSDRVIAMIPTYNESGNISDLIHAILMLGPEYSALVVDDNSPDGTWEIVQTLAAENPGRVHLLHRVNERGRGSAGIAGFVEALRLGADYVIEMDADWSHHPRFIPQLTKLARQGADVVVGSRLVKGGGETGRSPLRTLITFGANLYIRLVLGLTLRDCTSGFRVFRRNVLATIDFSKLNSNGPAIVQEMLMACKVQGAKFAESPIQFEERRAGTSTFNIRIMLAGLSSVLKFRLRDWKQVLRSKVSSGN
ncbi:TPA: polyprenol monophosphomannose synthase [Candidatus Sumerlaeota bacterium]|jgi:dolichol-phosphate mannosyltransferase|nr:polyprenol monophosphomannose synthase [Candidatus Sumerlaeota bacterium]